MVENHPLPTVTRDDIYVPRQWLGKPMNTIRWATIVANLRRLI